MAGRADAIGLFWQDTPRVNARAKASERPLPPIPETDWELPEGIDAYPSLEGQGAIAFDVESKDPKLKSHGPGYIRGDAYVCGIAVGTEAGFRQYYPIAHEIGPNLPTKHVVGWLKEELSRANQIKVGARLIYDLEALHSLGIKVAGPLYDVQVAEPLLDETRLAYSLEAIAQARLSEGKVQSAMLNWLRTAFGDVANIKKNIWRAPSAVVGPYAESDVDLPLRIFQVQKKLLEEEGLWELFADVESKLIPMLLAMRLRGVPVDIEHTQKLLKVLIKKQEDGLAAIKDLTGVAPDVWASDSLATVFKKLGVKVPLTKKTKKPSFRKEWLEAQTHPVAKMIVDARHQDKFRGTFIEGYILNGHVNGKIHAQFNQLKGDEGGTVSGRFSSSLPNLQNIPVRTAEGKLIRQAFIPEEGLTWWKFDWSQVEYRIIAHFAFATGQPGAEEIARRYIEDPDADYHQMVAELTGLARGPAKNLNFGLAYGQGIDLLCANLNVERDEGMRIMAQYHERVPFVKPLAALASSQANSNGLIKTLLQRRRRFNVWEKGGTRNKGRMSTEEDTNEYMSETNLGHFHHALTDEQLKRAQWSDEEILDRDRRGPDDEKYLQALRRNGWRRAFLHKALNALIQGSAADVMKTAMVQCWEDGVFTDDLLGAPHLTVHDELDGSMDDHNKLHVEALAHVKHVMETCVTLAVPLVADGGIGTNWGSLSKFQFQNGNIVRLGADD